MPAVIFFAGLDFEQKSSFMDGHYLEAISKIGFWLKIKTGPSFNPQTY